MVGRLKNNKLKKHKQKNIPIAVKIVIGVLVFAVVVFGIWLFKHYATWVYLKKLFATPSPVPEYTMTAAPEPTPSIAGQALQATAVPTPYIHPGDRDGKFTDGEVIEGELEYHSQDLSIEIDKVQEGDLTYFVAEVFIRDMDNFFAAFADGEYGKATEITTDMAKDSDAIFAVSGDYYNARDTGITIRNGEIYRDKPGKEDIMAVYSDGSIEVYNDGELTAEQLLQWGALDTYAFGPWLIKDGKVFYDENADFSFYVHPRCGFGMIEPYHYIFILVDGRKPGYSDGITINDFALLFARYGCTQAYNLDGGGSATMVFNGKLVNLPQGYKKQRGIGDAVVIREEKQNQPTQ